MKICQLAYLNLLYTSRKKANLVQFFEVSFGNHDIKWSSNCITGMDVLEILFESSIGLIFSISSVSSDKLFESKLLLMDNKIKSLKDEFEDSSEENRNSVSLDLFNKSWSIMYCEYLGKIWTILHSLSIILLKFFLKFKLLLWNNF